MLRTALISLLLFVSLSTSSSPSLRKSISRRQSDQQYCQAIEGFDCKCSSHRVTCTTDRSLPSSLNIVQNEKQKYQSVELVVQAEANIDVNDQTFAPVKELYKPDGDNYEFRLKFEKFTGLNLQSPGLLNRVFPDNLPSNARKHLALEIYNPNVQPNDNIHLFQNLNADSLELYALYPFRGTFQQLFDGANIKFIRLSGGDIRSDLSQRFTGNIARLELAKQANELSAQNFPVYPVHEYVINAYYITKFDTEHPPNYDNLAELRVHSLESIPANAFRQFPNVRVLSITTEKNIDPHALDGLNQLEKLTIKDANPSLDLLKNLPQLKEFETNVEKLDAKAQCQLIEKLANGQLAVQAVPNGRDCTCVSAYLDTASGRYPCDPQGCEKSSCAAIKNNYNADTRKFNPPPAIQRADGTDALRPRDSRVYTAPFQVARQDQDKHEKATVQQQPPPSEYDPNRPTDEQGQSGSHGEHGHHGQSGTENEGGENQQGGENQEGGEQGGLEGGAVNGTETAGPPKKGMSWLPIIIIAASIVGLLLIGLLVLFIRKRSARNKDGYGQAATGEPGAAAPRA